MFKATIIALAISWPIHGFRMTWFTSAEIRELFAKPMNRERTFEPLVLVTRADSILSARGK